MEALTLERPATTETTMPATVAPPAVSRNLGQSAAQVLSAPGHAIQFSGSAPVAGFVETP